MRCRERIYISRAANKTHDDFLQRSHTHAFASTQDEFLTHKKGTKQNYELQREFDSLDLPGEYEIL